MKTILHLCKQYAFLLNNIIFTVPIPHAFVTLPLQGNLKVNLSSILENIDKITCAIDKILVTYHSIMDRHGVALIAACAQENVPKNIPNIQFIVLNGCIATYDSTSGLDVNAFIEAFTPIDIHLLSVLKTLSEELASANNLFNDIKSIDIDYTNNKLYEHNSKFDIYKLYMLRF